MHKSSILDLHLQAYLTTTARIVASIDSSTRAEHHYADLQAYLSECVTSLPPAHRVRFCTLVLMLYGGYVEYAPLYRALRGVEQLESRRAA